MKRHIYSLPPLQVTIALLLILALCGLLAGCSGRKQGTTSTENLAGAHGSNTGDSGQEASSANSSSSEPADASSTTSDGFPVEDLLTAWQYLGQTPGEIGIPLELIREYVSWSEAYLDGPILWTLDYGIIHFTPAQQNASPVATSIWLHVKEVPYADILAALTDSFGEPVAEGQEPYAEINGGAVFWHDFETENLRIRLSQASEREYLEITFELSK
ncbi:MAG: hypothetical protein HUJ69_03935 [Lachnospiraceae bacterium]|nr:hypothetical protein [Lachnospiraceae bacterium]